MGECGHFELGGAWRARRRETLVFRVSMPRRPTFVRAGTLAMHLQDASRRQCLSLAVQAAVADRDSVAEHLFGLGRYNEQTVATCVVCTHTKAGSGHRRCVIT